MAGKPTAKKVKQLADSQLKEALELEKNDVFTHERYAFIDRFILCEITCNAYVKKYKNERKKAKDSAVITHGLDMRTIPHAFSFFKFDIPKHVLTPIFGTNNKKGHKTCKKIRNSIIHAMRKQDLEEMHDRFNQLMIIMDVFLSYFQQDIMITEDEKQT